MNSTQALVLMLLASVALIALIGASDWDERRRREFRLCGWLVAGLTLFLAMPLPTFQYYFLPVVPFVSILATLGLNVLGARLWPAARPVYVVLPFLGLFALGLGKVAVQQRRFFYPPTWAIVEDLAREVNRVTPQDGLINARDVVLFAAGRLPPRGMENMFGPLLRLPPEQLARIHVLPQSQIDARLATGQFDTIVIGTNDSRLQSLGLLRRYSQQSQLHGFYILSGPISAEGTPQR
jgi:hypothetical protein